MPPRPRLSDQERPLPDQNRKGDENRKAMIAYGRYAALGIQFVVTMCLLGWVGYWADGKLGTYPLLMILGFFLGATGSFISLLSAIPPVQKRLAASKSDSPPSNDTPSDDALKR